MIPVNFLAAPSWQNMPEGLIIKEEYERKGLS